MHETAPRVTLREEVIPVTFCCGNKNQEIKQKCFENIPVLLLHNQPTLMQCWRKHTWTCNHYKWDWPKSQFSMPDDSATVVWLRNLKVGNVYLFNFLQNTLKKLSFWKWEIRNLENVIFPSSAEPCRILQNSALVPQNSAEYFGENHEILRISAEFCGTPQNGFCSTELFCGTTKRNNIRQKSAELSKSVLRNCAGVFGSAELFCGTFYY